MMDLATAMQDAREGDAAGLARAFAVVYDELRLVAHRQLRRMRPGDTLNTTVLVHEAFLKLARAELAPADDAHFFALAARAMRQILVDAARQRSSARRGANPTVTTLEEDAIRLEVIADDLLAIDEALAKLEALDPDLGRLVEWRFYGGRTQEEIAHTLSVSVRTVRRSWRKARAFLYRELTGAAPD